MSSLCTPSFLVARKHHSNASSRASSEAALCINVHVPSPNSNVSRTGRVREPASYLRLLHLYLLRMPLLVVELSLQPDHLLGLPGAFVRLAALLLPLLLVVVQAVPIPLAVQLDVLVLRLWTQGRAGSEPWRLRPAGSALAPHPGQGCAQLRHAAGTPTGRVRTPASSALGGRAHAAACTSPPSAPRPTALTTPHGRGPYHAGGPTTAAAACRGLRTAASAGPERAGRAVGDPGWKRSLAAL